MRKMRKDHMARFYDFRLLMYIMSSSIFLFISCTNKTQEKPLFELVKGTGINFVNKVEDTEQENSFSFRNYYNGGGVALGDINNDSLADILLTSNMGENKLYLNKGGMQFEDITPKSGMKQESMWSTGAVMVDINHDGWLDIYVCNSGHIATGNRKNKLYINNRDLTFSDSTVAYGLDHSGYSTQASFFDYDLDGDLDCLIINNSPIPFSSLNYSDMRDADISKWNVAENLKGGGNHLYRNDNDHFHEVTAAAGLHEGLISFGLGVSVADINEDGYPDIYVGNDFIERDYLYINLKNGTFRDELEDRVQQISMSSMSTDVADINNDGHPEIFTTDMLPESDYRLKTTGTFDNIELYLSKQKAGLYHQYVRNAFQLNDGTGHFTEIANFNKTDATDWSWGALFFDADNDGLNDLFICNGINKDLGDLDFLDFFSNEVYLKMVESGKKANLKEMLDKIPVTPLPNKMYRNQGGLQFTDKAKDWGMAQPGFSNSAAYADLDNDGDLDLVVNNENQEAFVYRNRSREQTGNGYVSVLLRGRGGNRFGIGSKLRLYRGGEVLYREVHPSRGFQSSVDYRHVIGVGTAQQLDSLVVSWPDGAESRVLNPKINSVLTLEQPVAAVKPVINTAVPATGLLEVMASGMDRHREDDHIDFYYERNLPALLSKEGPRAACGDVNGDGLEDVYVGGAKGQGGQLYLQQKDGGFRKQAGEAFYMYRDFEDVAVAFLDADGDRDLDLVVCSGGNTVDGPSRELQHRLYKNDGKGVFTLDAQAFPVNGVNIAVVASCDYDRDGDMDLFVGGRSMPMRYGPRPRSYVYANDGKGHYTDVTEQLNKELSQVGMVTGAVWVDVTGDGLEELVVVGEWMYPHIYSYGKGQLTELKGTGLEQLEGWWQTVSAGDVNGDGKQDLLLGNIGENFYLRPDADHPVRMWVNDFDKNGTAEQFLTRRVDGRDMPVFLKREVTDQFPLLKKNSLHHSDYASKSIADLFGQELVGRSEIRTFNYNSSVVALNSGGGKFTTDRLPTMVQLSSVNRMLLTDVNGDGKQDLLIGGNLFTFQPQFGRLDGSYGTLLLGDGKGGWRYQTPAASGLRIRGMVRDICEVKNSSGQPQWLFLQNDTLPLFYKLHHSVLK